MRFILLTQYYPSEIGAPQIRLMSVVRLLRAKGHDVQVVTAMPNHLMSKPFDRYRRKLFLQEQWDGAPVFRSWMYTATGMGARRLLSYFSFYRHLCRRISARAESAHYKRAAPRFTGTSDLMQGRRILCKSRRRPSADNSCSIRNKTTDSSTLKIGPSGPINRCWNARVELVFGLLSSSSSWNNVTPFALRMGYEGGTRRA
jgi:hypothetical protein